MTMSDPVADLLTRIRNAQMVGKATLSIPSSKLKLAIAQTLKEEGYIKDFQVNTSGGKPELEIALEYTAGRPTIQRLARAPLTRLRVYKGRNTKHPAMESVATPACHLQGKFYPTGQPASDATRLPAETLDALSQALSRSA